MTKDEIRQKLKDTFQKVQSQSAKARYQTRLVIDPEGLRELLEDIVDELPGEDTVDESPGEET